MMTYNEMREQLLAKAAGDEDFRARLVGDAKAAIEEEVGFAVPDSVSIEVHEDTATTAHLVLPPAARLTTADLEAVAAGHATNRVHTSYDDHQGHDSRGNAVPW